jgi:hypothetical protein
LTRVPEPAHPALVEHGVHRHDALEIARDGGEVALLEHTRRAGGLEGVGRDRVPRAEDDVVERCERNEVLDQRVATLVAFAEADVRHLAERADRCGALRAGGEHAGHEGRGDRAESGSQDAETSGGGADGARAGHGRRV